MEKLKSSTAMSKFCCVTNLIRFMMNDSKMGTPSSARIIEYVDLALIALEIVYHTNGAEVEGLTDRNGHKCKGVGEGKSVSWVGERTKGEGRE